MKVLVHLNILIFSFDDGLFFKILKHYFDIFWIHIFHFLSDKCRGVH
jgi:hypothetical protein